MSRETRKRRRKKRRAAEKNVSEAVTPWVPPMLSDADRDRIRARFSSFIGRGHRLRFRFDEVIVDARTPDELERAMRAPARRRVEADSVEDGQDR